MRLSLNGRLILGFGLLFLLLAAQATLSVWLIQNNRDEAEAIASTKIPALDSVHQLDLQIQLQQAIALNYSYTPVQKLKEKLLASRASYDASLVAFELFEDRGNVIAVRDLLHGWYGQYTRLQDAIVQTSEQKENSLTEAEKETYSRRLEVQRGNLSLMLNYFLRTFDTRVASEVRFGVGTVATKVANDARWALIFAYATATLALVIGLGAVVVLRRGLSGPLGRLSEGMAAVAAGDLGRQISDGGIREFRAAAEGFNAMAQNLADVQHALSLRVAEQQKILDTIPMALLIIGVDRKIGPVYSKEAPEVLGFDDFVGKTLSELLYRASPSSDDDGKLLDRYIRQIFENLSADIDMLAELNPVHSVDYTGPAVGAPNQTLEVRFDRIVTEDRVEGVLVAIIDRTEQKRASEALEEEQKARRRDADSVEAILNHGPEQLQDFLDETRELLRGVRAGLIDANQNWAIPACFRKLHTIKGAASSLGLESVAYLAHEAESLLAPRRDDPDAHQGESNLPVNMVLGSIGTELDSIESLVARLKDLLIRGDAGSSDDPKTSLVASAESMLRQLSKTLSKELHLVHDIQLEPIPHLSDLKKIIIQLIRNAADHGIEDTYERLFRGKSAAGTIRLALWRSIENPKMAVVEVADDGAGLDYQAIEAKARHLGFLAPDAPAPPNNALLRYLFRPGFTTRPTANSISGRGVGLDLVKEMVDQLGGTVQVASESGKGTRFRILLPAS